MQNNNLDEIEAENSLQQIKTRHQSRLLRSDTLVLVAWVSVAIVIALFFAAEGVTKLLASPAQAFTSLGILSGLIGSDLVLLMLVLVARTPAIDQTFGHDKALAAHRKIGKPAFYFLVGHAILLIIGYSLSDKINIFKEIVSMWTTLADIPFAFIGLGLFIVVIVSSMIAVRRKLAYEVWHLIHLLSYAAVIFALPHQFSTGTMFTGSTWERFYWMAFYLMVAAIVLFYRFMLPLFNSLRHNVRVASIKEEVPGVFSITMEGKALDKLGTLGGQFFIWHFWTLRDWWHAHPFSLSALPTSSKFRVTVRDLGKGSRALASLKPGTRVWFEGPYGIFSQRSRTSPHMILVAAGIGVTPIRAMLEQADVGKGETTVIIRTSQAQPAYLKEELIELCSAKGAKLYFVQGSRPKDHESWQSVEALAQQLTLASYSSDITNSDVYVCGPGRWADLVILDAYKAGLNTDQVHVERFDW